MGHCIGLALHMMLAHPVNQCMGVLGSANSCVRRYGYQYFVRNNVLNDGGGPEQTQKLSQYSFWYCNTSTACLIPINSPWDLVIGFDCNTVTL